MESGEKWYQFKGNQLFSLRLFKKIISLILITVLLGKVTASHSIASISLAPLISVSVTTGSTDNYTSKVLNAKRIKENSLKDILTSEFQIILLELSKSKFRK